MSQKELNDTWLVQRLLKPLNSNHDNPFAFGGGLKNGGLSENVMKLLRPIFSFDYMGSAEFEFGVVPKAFQHIVKNIKDYGTWGINLNSKPLYVIGYKSATREITERIQELAKNKIHCKEYTGIDHALELYEYQKGQPCNYIGWLELDNNFLFFIDKDAFEKTASLFELIPKSKTSVK